MSLNISLKVATLLCFFLFLAACGENSQTNGTLTLNPTVKVTGAGTIAVTGSATVTTNATGTSLLGGKVDITVQQYGYDTTTNQRVLVETYNESPSIGAGGLATMTGHNFTQSQTMVTVIMISATCGGLTQSFTSPDIAKFVPVP